MSPWLSHHPPAVTPPGFSQWLGRSRLVPGLRRNLYRRAHWLPTRPPIASTQPLRAVWQAIPPGRPTCHLLWGQASAGYFPL